MIELVIMPNFILNAIIFQLNNNSTLRGDFQKGYVRRIGHLALKKWKKYSTFKTKPV